MRWGIATALAAFLFAFPAGALAAPPANDDFADREVLSGSLPIAVSGSNMEATKEPNEPTPDEFASGASGHTVWFEWEATFTGFATVSSCGGSIYPVLGVYTGGELEDLTEVAGKFPTQGPECPDLDGKAVTFGAVDGVTYEIVVDGALGVFGEGGQGSFNLEIEQTPVPANDDFANAEVLTGEMLGAIYVAGAYGHTWNATKEPGEPAHAGNPGGASVWYSWTAPSAGTHVVTGCGKFFKTLLAVYTGSSVAALTGVASDDHECSVLRFDAVAGTTYRIAIDGKLDSGTGQPLMGSVSVNLYREPPEPPVEVEPPPPYEVRRPDTAIARKTIRPRRRSATFRFGSTEAGRGFYCKLDSRPFAGCKPPKTYRHLSPGLHVFKVAAIGPSGNRDFSPAVVRFRMPRAGAR